DGATQAAAVRHGRLHFLRALAAVIWTVAILALCWTPSFVVRKVENGSFFRPPPDIDKVIHAGIFFVLAILWLRVSRSRRAIWVLILGGFALGVISEIGQMMPFVQRNANLFDLIFDCLGLLIGVAIAPWVEPWLARLE